MNRFILILIVLIPSCKNAQNKCEVPQSALWSIISDDVTYYEVYWDNKDNYFIFDGETGDSYNQSSKIDSLFNRFKKSIEDNPCNEKEISRKFFKSYLGLKSVSKFDLIGKKQSYISSNQRKSFQNFKNDSYNRYLSWLKHRDDSAIQDTLIEIVDTLR